MEAWNTFEFIKVISKQCLMTSLLSLFRDSRGKNSHFLPVFAYFDHQTQTQTLEPFKSFIETWKTFEFVKAYLKEHVVISWRSIFTNKLTNIAIIYWCESVILMGWLSWFHNPNILNRTRKCSSDQYVSATPLWSIICHNPPQLKARCKSRVI